MGMDVYGKNPTSEKGSYFRNNIWWWHPLAEFLTRVYPKLTQPCALWHSNDGDGLDAEQALALAAAVQRDLDTGVVARYASERDAYLASLPKDECVHCGGTGVRTDEVGRRMGLDTPRDPVTGKGGCNGCAGTGKVDRPETNYPFDVENVRTFVEFLRDSGGFEIC